MIIKATKENYAEITSLVPDELAEFLLRKDTLCLFKLDEEMRPVSLVLAQLKEADFALLWIFTLAEERKKGYGLELIQRLEQIAKRMGDVDAITAALPLENSALRFFVKAGFLLPENPDIEFETSVKGLSEQSLWRRKINAEDIVPLAEVPPFLFKDFEHEVKTGGNPANLPFPLSTAKYDGELSMACVTQKKLCGVLIVEKLENGELLLSGMQVNGKGAVAQNLIYVCGKKAIELYPPETPIRIIAINDISKKLIAKLISKTEKRLAFRLTLPIEKSEEENS
ncbi:MAG: GNAT family N-acetyltransferase [Oscillospiraceae bacterium]